MSNYDVSHKALCSNALPRTPTTNYQPQMPFSLFLNEAAIVPLRAVIFQSLLLLVAIAIEAAVLRRQLRLGFQPSIRYAASINILTVVVGWVVFLGIEPLLPTYAKTQIISYVLFGHFYSNSVETMASGIGAALVAVGLLAFFVSFWLKAKALEWLTWLLDVPIVKPSDQSNPNRIRYGRSRPDRITASPHLLAVLRANAFSFTVILLLLLVRTRIGQA